MCHACTQIARAAVYAWNKLKYMLHGKTHIVSLEIRSLLASF